MKKLSVIALMCALAVPASAETGKITASILPGMSIPLSGSWASDSYLGGAGVVDSGHQSSFALAASADYQFQDMLAAGLELGYSFKHALKELPAGTSGGGEKILQVTPYVKAEKKMGKYSPYGIVGLGMYNMKTEDYTVNGVSSTYDSKTYLGFNIGGGVMYELTSELSLGLDLRWHHIFSNKQDSLGKSMATNNLTPSLKLSYAFGK